MARARIAVAFALAIAAMPAAAAAHMRDEWAGDGTTPEFRQSLLGGYTTGNVSWDEHDLQDAHVVGAMWEAEGLPINLGVSFKPNGLLEMILMAGKLTE